MCIAYSNMAFIDVLLSVVSELTDSPWTQARFSSRDLAAYGSISEEHFT